MFCLSKITHLFHPRSRAHKSPRTPNPLSQDDPLTRSEEFLITPPSRCRYQNRPLGHQNPPNPPIPLAAKPQANSITHATISGQSNSTEDEHQPIASFTTGWYEILNDADDEEWVFEYVNDSGFGVTWPLRRVRKERGRKGVEEGEEGDGSCKEGEDGEQGGEDDRPRDEESVVLEIHEEGVNGREGERRYGTLSKGYEADDELTIGIRRSARLSKSQLQILHQQNRASSSRQLPPEDLTSILPPRPSCAAPPPLSTIEDTTRLFTAINRIDTPFTSLLPTHFPNPPLPPPINPPPPLPTPPSSLPTPLPPLPTHLPKVRIRIRQIASNPLLYTDNSETTKPPPRLRLRISIPEKLGGGGKMQVRLLPKRKSLAILREVSIVEEGVDKEEDIKGEEGDVKTPSTCETKDAERLQGSLSGREQEIPKHKGEIRGELGEESDATITPASYEQQRRSVLFLDE